MARKLGLQPTQCNERLDVLREPTVKIMMPIGHSFPPQVQAAVNLAISRV
jgi:hypothetical protein